MDLRITPLTGSDCAANYNVYCCRWQCDAFIPFFWLHRVRWPRTREMPLPSWFEWCRWMRSIASANKRWSKVLLLLTEPIADSLPMKIHSALCLAASTSVVNNDLSPRSAIATVANQMLSWILLGLWKLITYKLSKLALPLLTQVFGDIALKMRWFLHEPCCALSVSLDPFKF